jgi:hypothetical protein
MKFRFPYPVFAVAVLGIAWVFQGKEKEADEVSVFIKNGDNAINSPYDSLFAKYPKYVSDGIDFPVGKPDAKGYYPWAAGVPAIRRVIST